MGKRLSWLLVAPLILLLLSGAGVLYWVNTPPYAVRLLPEGEGVIYIDLRPVRLVTGFTEVPVLHEPEYAEFIKETGFQFERDLDQVALAVHPPEQTEREGAAERRFSEVFAGRYDQAKVTRYLHKLASDVERYREVDIFSIPHEGRVVRVAMLNDKMIAASNTSDAANIRSVIDRFLRRFRPFGGSSLLSGHYDDVPAGSPVWAILKMKAADGRTSFLPLTGGLNFSLPVNTVTVASVRFTGSIDVQVQAFCERREDAAQLADSAQTFLTLFRSIEAGMQPQGPDQDVKRFFDSIRVGRDEMRVTLQAEMPVGAVKKIFAGGPQPGTSMVSPGKSKSKR